MYSSGILFMCCSLDANNRRSLEGMQRLHVSSNLSSHIEAPYYHNNMSDVETVEASFETNTDTIHDSDPEASSEISI